ncbi:MAG: hypothetical protein AAGD22_14110, partial [Verrucomicrobiota bacterium]
MPSLSSTSPALLRVFTILLLCLAPVACKSNKNSGPEPTGRNVELNNLDQLVRQTLRDPQRSNSVIALMSQAEYDLGEINKVFEKRQKKFSKMAVDHKTTGRELDVFLNQWDAEENTYQRQLINRIYAIKRQVSPAEWSKIAPPLTNSIFRQSDRINQMALTNTAGARVPTTQAYSPSSAAPVSTRPVPTPAPPPIPNSQTSLNPAPVAPAPTHPVGPGPPPRAGAPPAPPQSRARGPAP